ncbi:MAG TPA: rhomboid family intramembrane serine protease [Luteolibacter sp.]|nr:rhomboid family intramembrane serine protease [Luteolibacter sp.]
MGLRLRSVTAAKASWTIAVILIAIQAAVSIGGGHDQLVWLFRNFGLSREGLLEGKLWQFLSYGLLHGGFLHVGLNAACIVLMGARIEHMLGQAAVWKTMGFGIIGGGIAHVLLAPSIATYSPVLVGASGGCVALLILLTTLSPDSRMWPVPISGRALGIGILGAELALALIDPQPGLPGLSRIGEILASQGLAGWFSVSHACHFGGGVAGYVCGIWLLRPRVTTARLRRDRERREAKIAKSGGH